jgi:hypothetical protein
MRGIGLTGRHLYNYHPSYVSALGVQSIETPKLIVIVLDGTAHGHIDVLAYQAQNELWIVYSILE